MTGQEQSQQGEAVKQEKSGAGSHNRQIISVAREGKQPLGLRSKLRAPNNARHSAQEAEIDNNCPSTTRSDQITLGFLTHKNIA